MDRLTDLKLFLENNGYKGMQTFTTRNIVGDIMSNIYDQDGITVDICYDYEYLEIFGLSEDEYDELEAECYINNY